MNTEDKGEKKHSGNLWNTIFKKIKEGLDRLEKEYSNFRFRQLHNRKKDERLKKTLSPEKYKAYHRQERKRQEKAVLCFAAFILIGIILLFAVIKVLIFGGRSLAAAIQSVFVQEVQVESETETEKVYTEQDITVGSTGCMLLHSPFIDSYPDENGEYDFSSIYTYIAPYYSAPDYMTCEFEGALGGEEMGYSGYPMFHSPDAIIENIRDSGVDLQFLANNHVYDAFSTGFHRTMQTYEKLGIAYSGIRKSEQEKQYTIADVRGVKLGFLNYVYETPGIGTNINGIPLDEGDQNLINSFDYDDLEPFYMEVKQNIASMKSEGAEFIIVQMHWGIEYQLTEADYQDEMAQKLCDLGVDAIIGGHPHCEQPITVLETADRTHSAFCVYSEGNALSNQRTYLMDEMPTGHTEDGVMVTLHLHRDTSGRVSITDVELLPTWVYRYQDEDGSKYFILPLDDVDHLEALTGIKDLGDEPAQSFKRTMETMGDGLRQAKEFYKNQSLQ